MFRPSKLSVDSNAQQSCKIDPCNVDIPNCDQREWTSEGSPWNNITSHFEECGVNEFVMDHLLSSFSVLFTRLFTSPTVHPIQ